MANVTASKFKTIGGQPHKLSYINDFEAKLLKALGGAGKMTKEGIPAYYTKSPIEDLKKGWAKFTGADWEFEDETFDEYNARTDATKKQQAAQAALFPKEKKKNYGAQLDSRAADANAANTALANPYNTKIENLNTAYSGFENRLNDLSNNFAGMDYLNYYDDPFTDADERAGFSQSMTDLSSLLDDYSGYDFSSPTAPEFTSSVSADNNTTRALTAPDLTAASNYGGLGGNIQNLINTGQGIMDERAVKEREYGRLSSGLTGDLSNLDRHIGRLDYTDSGLVDIAEDDYYRLTGDADRVAQENALYDQLGFTYDDYGIADDIGNLRKDYRDEEGRINQFSKDLLRDYGLYGDELGGYNITNEDELNALNQTVGDRIRDARWFDSDLDYDFSREISDLQNVQGDVGGMLGDRTSELDRIERTQNEALTAANLLDRTGDSAGIYNLADINELQQAVDRTNSEISGFSSLLPYDFSETEAPLLRAQADIDALTGARSSALDLIENPISGLNEELTGLDLHDEGGMRDIDDRLSNLGIDLASFTGGRAIGINAKITQAMGAVDGRLQELTKYRQGIEEKAKQLQSEVEDMQFYGLSDLDDPTANFEAQQKEADLYNAVKALDELKAIEARFAEERTRLEQDAANVAARNAQGSQYVLDQIGQQIRSDPTAIDTSLMGNMTVEEYLAMIGNQDEDENTLSPSGTFSQNVIVGA
jgi:hypothetical protein